MEKETNISFDISIYQRILKQFKHRLHRLCLQGRTNMNGNHLIQLLYF